MVVKELNIQNFQAHKQLTVQFSPHITTIKGPTDAGKSAILRALRWVCLNDMAGDEFIRDGADSVLVEIMLHKRDAFIVSRSKTGRSSGNLYKLDNQEFKAFGTSVPDPIKKVLPLNEINFQEQHDSPFWFKESAPEVSRQLNRVIDLSIIDSSLANIGAEVRRQQDQKEYCTERLTKLEAELKALEPSRQRPIEFKLVVKGQNELEQIATDRDRLAYLIERIRANNLADLQQEAKEAEDLLTRAQSVRKLQSQIESLGDLIEDITDLDKYLDTRAVLEITTAENAFHKATHGKKCPLCQKNL